MALFRKKKEEIRADNQTQFEDSLLKALLDKSTVTKETAMQIPTVASSVSLIGDLIAATPIKLYRDENGKSEEVKDDIRVKLLNEDPKDTLDSNQFWHAIVKDFFLGKGGYAYIEKKNGDFASLRYVDEINISVVTNQNPIFKDYDIWVQGVKYYPFDFLKILRNTKDGATGHGVTEENNRLLSVMYNSLLFEETLSRKAGAKKGFLKSEKKLDELSMAALKESYARLYSNSSDEERVVVLNNGISFEGVSASAAELQMNENKKTNSDQVSEIFHIPIALLNGSASNGTAAETLLSNTAKIAVIPIMKIIESALNRDFLLEKEKSSFYYAFDTKELLKGAMKDRFEAYRTGIESNVLQPDEARYMEDLPSLGLNFVKLGLNDVLLNPKNGDIYTPNTGKTDNVGKGGAQT